MTEKTTVIFRPKNCNPELGPKTKIWFDNIMLSPGARNLLSDSELETLISHPDFPRYENWKAIEVKGEAVEVLESAPGAADYPASLAEYSVDEAEDIVNEVDDPEVLRAWFEQETRVTLRKILARQIEEIT
jgi:hypothetical protein